jgi:hypothetical protein
MRNIILAALLAGASVAAHADSEQSELRGQYDLKDGSRLTITEYRHTLYAQLDNAPALPLKATGRGTYADPGNSLVLEFIQAPNGSVSGVNLSRQQTVAEREQAQKLSKNIFK